MGRSLPASRLDIISTLGNLMLVLNLSNVTRTLHKIHIEEVS